MICPICNENMENGIINIPSGMKNPINLYPYDVFMQKAFMPFTKKGIEKAGGVVLLIDQSLMMPHINAYNCRKCRKIIIDY